MQPVRPDGRTIAPEDVETCLALLKHGSKSFHAASRLLPQRLRAPVQALYAFCRLSDDAVDESPLGEEVLARMHRRLDSIYSASVLTSPVDRAFAATVRRHCIPQTLPEALFEGFAWDEEGRRYRTLSDVRAYAVRVAGTVGVMMALIMGVRQPDALARACDLGVAMQLTNIARDIGEDARAGRLYLPLDWFAEAGIDAESWLTSPVHDVRIAAMARRLLEEADRLYHRSEWGIAALPTDCRPAIFAARYIYASIGTAIAANAFDSMGQRAHVGRKRKMLLLARAWIVAKIATTGEPLPALPEAQYLVDTIGVAEPAEAETGGLAWLLDLFERLERLDREGAGGQATA